MKIFIDNLHVKAILYMDKKLRKSVEGILSDTQNFLFNHYEKINVILNPSICKYIKLLLMF